jgi:AraC-like DNA-binding protein
LQARYRSLEPADPAGSDAVQQEDAFLLKVRALVEAHLEEEDFGIHQLCHELGISRTQLQHKLKALTGKSASLVIRSILLQKARELLKNTDLIVSEVGYAVGFINPSYFTTVFKEEIGQAPSSFRSKQ